eukprot:scaffold923_cov256-Pinguiococcus_pyrenoidosus.AAC.10
MPGQAVWRAAGEAFRRAPQADLDSMCSPESSGACETLPDPAWRPGECSLRARPLHPAVSRAAFGQLPALQAPRLAALA